jgi:hypothetical protein
MRPVVPRTSIVWAEPASAAPATPATVTAATRLTITERVRPRRQAEARESSRNIPSGDIPHTGPTPASWLKGRDVDVTVCVEEAQREDELRAWLVVRNRLEPDEPLSFDEARIPQA